MSKYRHSLPQLSDDVFLTDAGVETDLIFNHGIEIREFAAHTLLPDAVGRGALERYFDAFLDLAEQTNAGFILDSQTWKAHMHWAGSLGATEADLEQANADSVRFITEIRDRHSRLEKPIVLNAPIGPRGDAYAPDAALAVEESQSYHARQIGWLARTEVDMVTAMTFTQSAEAAGVVRAGVAVGLPVVVSFTVETDGRLPNGERLDEAVAAVDASTDGAAAYFMINCAHPEHFMHVLGDGDWARRIRGIRCNASRRSHQELDNSTTLDAGDPQEFGEQYKTIRAMMPWLNVFGGCCGSDLRHVTAVSRALNL